MDQSNLTNVLYLSIAISSSLLLYHKVFKKHRPFPPGPKPLPLIGNLLDIPKSRTYKKFEDWAKIYGGIVHVDVLDNHIIILNDPKYVVEILESKGRMYSERPKFMMAGELVGWGDGPALRPFDNVWTEQRKYISNFMGTRSKVEGFESVIRAEVGKLLVRIMSSNPEKQLELFQLYSGSIVLMLVYGYKVVDENDPLVEVVNKAMDHFGETIQSGAFAVDLFPMLRFVPSWFPGTAWKAKATKYRQDVDEMLERPYNWTKEQMKLGTARSCFLTDILEKGEYTPEQQRIIQWGAAGIYSGGASTTAAALSCFILGIVRHTPELKRAQAEIQALVGDDRLPTLADRPHLPYFEALCLEIHRVYTIGPLGLQHVAREDDVHDGYFIPKGAILITNNFLFYRNEKLYPNPNEFAPERFLEFDAGGRRKQQDPRDFMFGYGRRSCPGVHFANAMLWLASAALITAFDFGPVVEDGKPDIPSGRFLGETITYPEPFKYVIKPRMKISETLLQDF